MQRFKTKVFVSSLTLPPDPDSVTQTIKRVNFQIKISLQSLNQNITFPSSEQNGWEWCDEKLIMVPISFTRSQLPPTVTKRSHRVKVTKKNVYLSDDNLADDEENITEPKRKRKQKLITVSPSSESDDSGITELNRINTFGKKRLIDKFYEGDNENENVQVPEKNNSSENESDWEVSDFLSSEDSCDEWLP